jgi:SAM-dependent methyltransferase
MRVLNLGCGNVKREFAGVEQATEIVGVDISSESQADVILNLDETPYPFESDSFDLIIMQDVIEHLENTIAVMNEVHRIARNGAIVRVRTPHYSSYYAYNDPTHKRFFGSFVFDAFDADQPFKLYTSSRFRIRKRELQFPKLWRVTGVAALAHRYTRRWEQLFAFMFRAENMYFELEAVK